MSKIKKTFVFSLSIVLFYLILSCENPMVKSILPDNDAGTRHERSYTVAYNANGGNGEMNSSVFSIGLWEKLPTNTFTRLYYMFTGWAVSADGDVEYADQATVKDLAAVGETVTLYAKWGVNVYIVDYNSNGGEGHMAPDVFAPGQTYALAANTFIREGYIFNGWAISADEDVEYADQATVKDLATVGRIVTLYAVWESFTYTVEYNANGGDGEMDDSEFTYNKSQELRPNAFILDGYVFAGWSTSKEGDVEYANGESVLNLTSIPGDTITLYAKWGFNIFTVSYVANGGSGYMSPDIIPLGQDFTLAANTFTREGYFFIGWSLLNNGEVHCEDGDVIEGVDVIAGETIRFYAVWLPDMAVIWPNEMHAVYGQTLSEIWLPGGAYSEIPGTFTWAAPNDSVGNLGVNLHNMIFTPEDMVNYDVVNQDVEITVYPKAVYMTGTPGRTLIPFDSADMLYGNTSTLRITLDGLLNDDTVTLAVSEGYGLSLSGNTGIGNDTQSTVNVSYDGTTLINESGPVNLELYISDNDNYMLCDVSDFALTILDGQIESRAIPVTQTNIVEFNSYANTEIGLTRHYKLAQDITSSGWEPIGTSTGQFNGSFDGNGFTISNLSINRTVAYLGIFGYIGPGGVVKNIGVINGDISGGNYTGGIAGYNNNGTIQSCYVTGSVNGESYTGGVVGLNNGTVQNCYVTSNVSGGSNVGGVIGQNNSTVQNCYAIGSVGGTNYIGGIVGLNNSGTVRNCAALNFIVTTSGGADANIGRVAGSVTSGTMSNNYARGDMGVKYSWNKSNGSSKTITTTGVHNGIDGSAISPEQYNTQSWWVMASIWYPSGMWDFTNIWEMKISNIPKLKTAGGSQNYELLMGDGNETNPYRIYNEATLKKVGTGTDGWDLDKHYLQIQDITLLSLEQSNWMAIGTENNMFTGTYNGGGYTIFNITINNQTNYQGMFGYIGAGGEVKNLGLIGGNVRGGTFYTGGVTGYNSGTVENCYVTGNVSGGDYYTGGVVGRNSGTVENCYATSSVSGGTFYTGGVTGYNSGTVQNCYATGSVNGSNYIGGVVGYNVNGTVQNCYTTSSVSGDYCIGGVVGINADTVQNCSALNPIITASGGNIIGRVVGTDTKTMANNFARADMIVRYNWNGSTGTNNTINAGLTTVDGVNISQGQYNTQSWWQNTANWTSGGAWNFKNTWEMNVNNLPMLKNASGIQDHFISSGDGTEASPFPVYDVDTLRKVGSGTDGWTLNRHYRQVQDITLSSVLAGQSNWTAVGTSSSQFTGSFDGNGFTISNLTINGTSTYRGIFGYIGTDGVAKNIGLVNVNISGENYTGSVAGYNNGTIQSSYITGNVSGGTYTGGIAGFNNGVIQNCYGINSVSGIGSVGGVAGQNNGTIQNCYTAGSVGGSSGNIGGIVGLNNSGTVRNCAALNPSVITSGSSGNTIGRVSGTGGGTNNYARSDMVVKYNWNGFGGTNKSVSPDLTTVDGSNITAVQWNNVSWWQTAANWNTTSGALVWNFTGTWEMNLNNIPRIKTTGGVQNHALNNFVDFMEMVWIPAGSFTMGSPVTEENRFDDEGPQHTVTLTGFYMGKYTVTQGQYQVVIGMNPSNFLTAAAGENVVKLPVEKVTWYDAVEFCNKLSQLEGLTPVYTISGRTPVTGYPITSATVTATLSRNGYRLPTEAQWEYACRAGTSTAYNTGEYIDYFSVWYNFNSMNTTHEVGQKPANAWGLYDMHGNVWEWCGDWFGNYTSGTQTNPIGVATGLTRVTRGGSWYSSPQGVRSACRNGDLPSGQFANLGFRIVRP